MVRLIRPIARIPLVYKALIANSAIVIGGALVGTWVTATYVSIHPDKSPFEVTLVVASLGTVVSVVTNFLLLKAALMPLEAMERTAQEIGSGNFSARVPHSPFFDAGTERLAHTMNQMLDMLAERTRSIAQYSEQLQTLSARILRAQEEERKRIARELHDDTGQALTSIAIGLKVLQQQPSSDEIRTYVSELLALTHQALDGVHRMALELRPKTLDDLGLIPALRWHMGQWSRKLGIASALNVEGWTDRLPAHVETAIYRVIQEALTNVAKHSRATKVQVTLSKANGYLRAVVEDDGVGFEPSKLVEGTSFKSLGLFGMQERMALVGGSLKLESVPGKGTKVELRVPVGDGN
jgi:two-component system sensor histidine kinase UhpB